jgi:hypothetical protein
MLSPEDPLWDSNTDMNADGKIDMRDIDAVARQFGAAAAQKATVEEIMLAPSAWVNKTVVIEGSLTGPLFFAPEVMPPWNYMLSSNGTIGVLWTGAEYDSAFVKVYGVVRKGWVTGILAWPWTTCYYIQAVRVELL